MENSVCVFFQFFMKTFALALSDWKHLCTHNIKYYRYIVLEKFKK